MKSRTPEYQAAYYRAHKEERAAYWAKYYAKHRARLLPLMRANFKHYYRKVKLRAIRGEI